jgi:hypothetical protein
MHRKIRFKNGERVNGLSVSGKKILGEYRGTRASYGAYVFGIEVGRFTPAEMHVCHTLTLERAPLPKTDTPKKVKFKTGDLCIGLTKDGHKIIGSYMNSEGKFAWIRGQKGSDITKLELKSAFKVLTKTLQKV